MSAQPPVQSLPEDDQAQLGPRPITLRAAAYTATAVLALAMLGIAAGPSSGAAPIVMWSTVLIAAASLLGVVFFTQDVPQKLEQEYERNIEALTDRFEQLSARDWATGLFTTVEFTGAVKMELSRSRRYQRSMSVVVVEPNITVDDPSSNAVVKFIADATSDAFRESDVLGRSGTEVGVFALLPETEAADAGIAANRLLEKFESAPFKLPGSESTKLAINVAIAAYPGDAQNADALIDRARSRLA